MNNVNIITSFLESHMQQLEIIFQNNISAEKNIDNAVPTQIPRTRLYNTNIAPIGDEYLFFFSGPPVQRPSPYLSVFYASMTIIDNLFG